MSTRSERRQPVRNDLTEEDGGAPARRRRPTRRSDSARPDLTTGGALTGLDDVRAPLAERPGGSFRLRRRDLLTWGGAAALLPVLAPPSYIKAVRRSLMAAGRVKYSMMPR